MLLEFTTISSCELHRI